MLKAYERKINEAYELANKLLGDLKFLEENEDGEFPTEKQNLKEMIEAMDRIYKNGLYMEGIVESLRDINEALDHLYYKNSLVVQIFHAYGI